MDVMQQEKEQIPASAKPDVWQARQRGQWRPWLWVAPAIILVAVFLVYPMLSTIWYSFFDATSVNFVGFDNYTFIFGNRGMLEILRNNLLWLVLATLATVALGLIVATLVDRVPFESAAKATVFIPMAISFVAAGIIWRFVYYYVPPGRDQIGILNASIAFFGGQVQSWITQSSTSNFMLIIAYTWMWTGFCMVILSAALKSIPADIMEAARTDGANGLTIFFRITIPMITPTIVVVATTMVINILKIFDIIYVMTGGNYGTNVVAVAFYQQLFNFNQFGRGSALTVILLLAVLPIMYFNVRRFRAEEAQR